MLEIGSQIVGIVIPSMLQCYFTILDIVTIVCGLHVGGNAERKWNGPILKIMNCHEYSI